MPVKNNVIAGMLLGSILPLLAYLFSDVVFKDEMIADKPGVPYLLAVGINLIIMKFIFKTEADKAAAGIILVTFLASIFAFVFKIKLR